MADEKVRRKLGPIALGTAVAFIIGGNALFQVVLRDYIPPHFSDGGWYDSNRGIAAGVVGGLSGLIGASVGYCIERLLRK